MRQDDLLTPHDATTDDDALAIELMDERDGHRSPDVQTAPEKPARKRIDAGEFEERRIINFGLSR